MKVKDRRFLQVSPDCFYTIALLSKIESRVLAYLLNNAEYKTMDIETTPTELAELLELERSQVTRVLNKIRDIGLLTRSGSRKKPRYILNPDYFSCTNDKKELKERRKKDMENNAIQMNMEKKYGS